MESESRDSLLPGGDPSAMSDETTDEEVAQEGDPPDTRFRPAASKEAGAASSPSAS